MTIIELTDIASACLATTDDAEERAAQVWVPAGPLGFLDQRLPFRFWEKVRICPEAGCWLWTGALSSDGYGSYFIGRSGGRTTTASPHLAVFRASGSRIPDGWEVDHLCRVRNCCNPTHLEGVTRDENVRRGAWAQKTHCPQGHEYTPENTKRGRKSGRCCRQCRRDRQKADFASGKLSYAKRKAKALAKAISTARAQQKEQGE